MVERTRGAAEKVYGKKPTHVLKVKQRHGSRYTSAGVGWLNEDGSFSISLSPCVVISHADDVLITLFPKIDRTDEVG